MISLSTFSQSTELKSKWKITINTPPSRSWPRTSSLSSPFLTLVSTAAVPAKPAKRPPEALQPAEPAVPAEPQESEESGEEEPRKWKTPSKRTAALDEQLRIFKVLMRPAALQIKELMRCFSGARLRYNQTNALIKGGAPRNKVKLRNKVSAMPKPE